MNHKHGGISILPRKHEHLEQLIKLFDATFKTSGYPVHGLPSDKPNPWPSYFTGDDPSAEVEGLVACLIQHGETIVAGHVSIRQVDPESDMARSWRAYTDGIASVDRPIWKMACLAVHPDHQGQGVGKALSQEVESRAQRAGARLVLTVLEKDVPAMRLYEKRGWKCFGQGTMTGRDGREWIEYYYVYAGSLP